MEFGLGIDAGGTYTDAVIIDFTTQHILAKAKALTTKEDYSRGISAAISKLPAELVMQVQLVALSTTLSTNAIVEGKGCKVGALVIGFDDDAVARTGHQPIRSIAGRMDITGHELEALDERAARHALTELLETEQVGALAISGMVSAMNPAHERRVREIALSLTNIPVVCAHELSMELDSIKRTVTTALNARLLPIIADLIADMRAVMDAYPIHAPLMVVRGDGTLMSEELARQTPVETILSGPAASVGGAQFLTEVNEGLIVDIGGTTSDIAVISDGAPKVSAKGVRVAGWTTNVRAVDIETVGLGGDSAVTLGRNNRVLIGPRRAIPLAFLADSHPQILEELRRRWKQRQQNSTLVQPIECFMLVSDSSPKDLSASEKRTVAALTGGPLSREQVAKKLNTSDPLLVPVDRLETLGIIQRSTLTPTDIMHYQGTFTAWNREAAELGLRLFAHRAGVEMDEMAYFILDTFSYWMTVNLMHRLIRERVPHLPPFPDGPADRALFDMLADRTNIQGLTVRAHFENPLVAIGAPAGILSQEAAEKLGARLVVPEHAEVANAVGAITGACTIAVEATITPDDDRYLVHSPSDMREFASLEDAREWTKAHLLKLLDARVSLGQVAGFTYHRDVQFRDRSGATEFGSVFLECRVRATAVGKPEFASFTSPV